MSGGLRDAFTARRPPASVGVVRAPVPRRGVVPTRRSLWVGPIELRLRHPHVPRVLLDRKTRSWKTTTTSSLELKLQYRQPSRRSALLSALAARASVFSALTLNVDLGGF
jgi:hypothetical protein